MRHYGDPNYRVGLIIARAQPLHNGHIRAITEALTFCDELIVSFLATDKMFFDYNINQKIGRTVFNINPRIAYYGTDYDESDGIPKHHILKTLNKLEEDRYNMPAYFFSNDDDWIEASKECGLTAKKIATLAAHNSNEINQSIMNDTTLWREKVPYASIETIETYIANKKRNNLIG